MSEHPATPARFLVVLDADSTLLQDEVIELLAVHAGSQERVAAVTERAMRGELDFGESLRERVATLAGVPDSVFAGVSAGVRVTPGAAELVAGVHAAGGRVGVVSGGFHEILDPVADALALDYVRANRLCCRGGALTGEVHGRIIDAGAKAEALREWAADSGVPPQRTIAVGDGANDLEMMAVAALAVAFNAKPLVRERADLVLGGLDLAQLLPVLGLRG
ncbi:phosphoserine phosphatase SerB [Rathayibacter rathayi]|uniref:phosphoserine phosphatase SerB n=1 Tax=Rathayibacter rathayi TaxID=33887 RepID=UPI000CE7ABC8|nr:phosphoserine phosphatase SerB [Rathayibacter rathayi]PPG68992.1 phosphoserine phosphatase SerB [Rathayibacter rathayi]PPG78603.1 phosphoserine phosphatase SerB [Rathayibacter rathayi]PPG90040.1 phosphoserine phosphatase SerB [Rathayibacter rathayi]PPG97934.1 phosphoserine phosphatase SerB [Rathayibacter rathayi]PPH23235.1 phosphoserine phosphatase SerB [Rathayibacter rathayi]